MERLISETTSVIFDVILDRSDEEEIEIVSINVGGKLFQTYNTTLLRYPNSLLGDGERRKEYLNEDTGEYYFDRHRFVFEAILYYYQSEGILHRPTNIPLDIFIEEIIFFDIGDEVIEELLIENGIKEKEEEHELPKSNTFKMIWCFLEYPDSSKGAKIFAIISIIIIVISLILFVIVTTPEFGPIEVKLPNGESMFVPNEHDTWLFILNAGVIIWFSSEFLLRLVSCPNIFKFLITPGNIIDFLSILPFFLSYMISSTSGQQGFLSLLRVIRVLRVLKLARHSRGLQIIGNTLTASTSELMMITFLLFLTILLFGSILYYTEHKVEGTEFKSIPHAAWWAIVTMTTVGYGDMAPVSAIGKLAGSFTALCGVMMMALPVPSVCSNFSRLYEKERNREKAAAKKEKEDEQKELKLEELRIKKKERADERAERAV